MRGIAVSVATAMGPSVAQKRAVQVAGGEVARVAEEDVEGDHSGAAAGETEELAGDARADPSARSDCARVQRRGPLAGRFFA